MTEHFAGWQEPNDSVEDFIDGMVKGFFSNLDELVTLTPSERADVEMVIRHHVVNSLLRRIKPKEIPDLDKEFPDYDQESRVVPE